MKKYVMLFLFLLTLSFVFTACNKDADNTLDDANIRTVQDLTAIEDLVLDIDDEIDEIIANGLADNEIEVRNCPTRTATPVGDVFPKTIVIDFGESCTTQRGRVKSGKVIVVQSAPARNTGATRTVSFENHVVDGVQITGTANWVNNGNRSFTRSFNHTLTFPDGAAANLQATHTYTQTAGADTPRISDDVFEIRGSASGVNRAGKAYRSEITEPLVKAANCRWVGKGMRQVNRDGNTFVIDYGFGVSCDNRAQVTLPNGETRIVRIEVWWRR
ncbi:MAG TPA: hypothetical protein PKD70_06580 [Saprospiraceae bacterium]|nr:hypothetical protein [Saprospiraceae bacterium]